MSTPKNEFFEFSEIKNNGGIIVAGKDMVKVPYGSPQYLSREVINFPAFSLLLCTFEAKKFRAKL